jgi:dUTP pyrophosphatase
MNYIEKIKRVDQLIGSRPLFIKLKKLDNHAVIPTYAHDGDVGMDLTAISVEYDKEKDMYIYHTGLALESDKHYGILLFPRSSNRKTDAYLCNHVGIVDSYIYRGEIMLCFKNRDSIYMNALKDSIEWYKNAKSGSLKARIEKLMNDEEFAMSLAPYNVGDRVAQMVVMPYPNVVVEEVENLSDTVRGEGGFGSTGN